MTTVNLTPNAAIEMICNGEFQGDEVKPVVQVSDIKQLSASFERYRMILSDGVHCQQGMLATQLNSLIHQGKLQKGSIVQLSHFVSQMIQNRKIIIIIGLNVILEKCDPIGEPKTYVQGGGTATGVPQARPSMPVQSSMDQPGNRQSYAAASLSNGPPPGPNINGKAPMQHPKTDFGVSAQPYGGSFPSNSDFGRYGTAAGPPAYPKAEPGGPLAGNYSDQNRSSKEMRVNLTPNAIEMICNGEFQGDEVKPVVQVSDIKQLSAGQQNSSERYQMMLSDGVHCQQGMLAPQLNSLIHEGKLQKGSIVQLSESVGQTIQNRKIIIVIKLNILVEKCDLIGEPQAYTQIGRTSIKRSLKLRRTMDSMPTVTRTLSEQIKEAVYRLHQQNFLCS